MNLREHMESAVDRVSIDHDRLVAHSRRRGARLRRRRHTLGVFGATAVLAVGLPAAYVVTTGAPETAPVTAPYLTNPTPSTNVVPDRDPDGVALTGRSTVAVLRAAIESTEQGTFGGYAGQGIRETYGEIRFTPANGTGVGVVGVNVQDGSILDGSAFDCAATWMDACEVSVLDNGDRVRTYQDRPEVTDQGLGLRIVAERLTHDRSLRVMASATNGFNQQNDQWDITRSDPVLTTAQLRRIVSGPRWGFEVSREYQAAGQRLSPYTDLDSAAGQTSGQGADGPAPTPSAGPSPD